MNGNDPANLRNCEDCGRLCVPETPVPLCRDCAFDRDQQISLVSRAVDLNQRTTPEIAHHTGLSEGAVRKALREMPALSRYVEQTNACEVCRRRAPIQGSRLCLSCQIDTLYELRMAADESFERAESMEYDEEPHRPPTVSMLLDEKRGRTGTARVNPVGAQRVKPYR